MSNRVSRTISDDQLNRIIQIESAGKPEAKASTSSATGLFQFIAQTWLATVKKHGPRALAARIVQKGKKWIVPDGGEREILNMRKGTTRALRKFNVEMGARFTEDNARILGTGWSDGDLYLAHFLGVGDARDVLRAPQGATVDKYVSAKAIAANRSIMLTRKGTDSRGRPIYDYPAKTCGQVRAWAESSMHSRWTKAGRPDWIDKYWYPSDEEVEPPEVDEEHPPVKVEVEDEPEPPHGKKSAEIRDVQQLLTDFKYHEVGEVDGKWGGRTRGAIAAYKNDRHLPGPPEIDDALIADMGEALEERWTRPIAEARATATAEKVAEKVETVEHTWWSRLLAKLGVGATVGGGGAVGLADVASDHFETATDWWNKIHGAFEMVGLTGVPWWLWVVLLGFIFGLIWKSQRKAEQATIDAYRDGRIN